MFQKLDEVQGRYRELNSQLADPSIAADPQRYQKLAKEHASLQDIVDAYVRLREVEAEIEDNKTLFEEENDELKAMARAEIAELEAEQAQLTERLRRLLIPKDPLDEKNILLEIRAGTGGDEAALFVGDLFRMYDRYAANCGWKVDIVEANQTETGGFKEVIAMIEGDGVYSHLKYEGGTHRVQRVPATESQGRIHTSAVTVAVLPEAEDVELDLDMNDLKFDTYRSSGPGGQSVNTTDSAIRITYIPTGMIVTCQDEKSQHKNRAKALKVMKTRLLELKRDSLHQERAAERRDQVGSGDRSERIRTYNFPQSRITDHRIGFSTRRLDDILAGDLDALLDPLHTHFQAERLQHLGDDS